MAQRLWEIASACCQVLKLRALVSESRFFNGRTTESGPDYSLMAYMTWDDNGELKID